MSENRSRDFSVYDEMSTEELEEILRADFDAPEGEETDMDIILYVTDLLTERRLAGDVSYDCGHRELQSALNVEQTFFDKDSR